MIIIIEALILCILFSVMVFIMSRNPISTLYNYPPKIQERVKSLEDYRGKIPTEGNKLFAKCLVSFLIVVVFSLILRYINGYTTFIEGFGFGLLLWTIVNVYDAFIIDICWFCQNPRFIFKGTEDMMDEYHNYWFHIKESIKGEVIALVVCAIVGFIIQFIL